MTQHRIRPLVLCIFRKAQQILVHEGYDPIEGERFYRPLGGGIEFGEQSRDTAVREMKEELGAEICNLCYLGTIENIFSYNGNPGHEIVLLYEAGFVDSSIYEQESPPAQEIDGSSIKTVWLDLAGLESDDALPLYPDGLRELLSRTPA